MAISPYLKGLRERVGKDLLLLPGVAAVVRDGDGRILLIRREDDNQWAFPAGAIDPGEAPAQSLAREVWQETGLKVVPERLLGVFGGEAFRHTYPNGDQIEPTTLVFSCRTVGGELGTKDGEAQELRYFPPDQLPPLEMPYPPEFLRSLSQESTYFQWDPSWLEELAD